MEMKKTIDICFISDDNFAVQTRFAISSIVLHKYQDTVINVYIIAVNISLFNINLFKKLSQKNVNIHIITMENKFKDIGSNHIYVSKSALLKFILPNIFSDKSKILYMDGDIYVSGDLTELYHNNVTDVYAAVVPDYVAQIEGKDHLRLGLKNYFNSGVMLLNLKKMRQDNISEKLLAYKKTDPYKKYMDQDAFNKVFSGNVKILSEKYNFLYLYYKYVEKKSFNFINYEDILVTHFAGGYKPYNDITIDKANELMQGGLVEDILVCQANTIKKINSNVRKQAEDICKVLEEIRSLHEKIEQNKFYSKIKRLGRKLFYESNDNSWEIKFFGIRVLKIENLLYKKSISILGIKFNVKPLIIAEKLNNNLQYHINNNKLTKKIKKFSGYGITRKKRTPRLIISLTSFPQRMKDIHFTLYSLLTQETKPDEVILWLGADKFPNKEKDIPKTVLKLCNNGLTIKWCEDIRAFTKLVPALTFFPDDIIVTADDDIFYPPNWLTGLYKAHKKDRGVIFCHRAHKINQSAGNINPYALWKKETSDHKACYTSFLTGVGGVLYPPHSLYKDVLENSLFLKLTPYNDDIWFWAMAVMKGTKVKVVNDNIKNLIYVNLGREIGMNDEPTLGKLNVVMNANEKQFSDVLDAFPDIKKKLLDELKGFYIEAKDCPGRIARVYRDEAVFNADYKEKGLLTFGPYIDIPQGQYDIELEYVLSSKGKAEIIMANKIKKFVSLSLPSRKMFGVYKFSYKFEEDVNRLELKIMCLGGGYIGIKNFRILPQNTKEL